MAGFSIRLSPGQITRQDIARQLPAVLANSGVVYDGYFFAKRNLEEIGFSIECPEELVHSGSLPRPDLYATCSKVVFVVWTGRIDFMVSATWHAHDTELGMVFETMHALEVNGEH